MDPDEDDDRTLIRPRTTAGRTALTPASQTVQATERIARADVPATASSSQHTLSLPNGTRLAEFELTETLGEGGFGIVYLAWDHSLDRRVALKEYMPSAIATRVGRTEIRPRSERHQETFEAGLKSFINEAKLLAQFDHPALVKVYRFWEANGTAYMVMPFYEGVTLRDAVRGFPQPPDEAWILALLEPLFHALSMLHAAQCFHRDIAPDNILLLAENGRPLLLDFGAARRVIGDMTQALTAILKPGYAPIEQYAEVPGLKQGAWTDVYALAAVVHWMIAGKTPPASVGRMFGDSHVPLAEREAGKYSARFLEAIDRALAVLPVNRTQTIEALRQDMTGIGSPPAVAPAPGASAAVPRTVGPVTAPSRGPTTRPSGGPTPDAVGAPDGEATASRRWLLPALIAGIVVVGAAAGLVLFGREPVAVPPVLAQPEGAGATAAPPQATAPPTAPPPQTASPQTPPAQAMPTQAAPTQTAVPTVAAPVEAAVAPAARPAETPLTPALPPAATRPRADPDPQAATRRAAPSKPERRADPAPVEPRVTSDNTAECARLFQRLSIGESHPEIIERVKALRCR